MQFNRSLVKRINAGLLLSSMVLFCSVSYAEKVTDIVGREVDIPEKVNRILLGEGRLIHAVALLEGQQPFKRIVGWQGDFRKLDVPSYTVYKEKFPEIDQIPLIGNTTENSISAEKVLTLNADIAIFGLSGHGPGKDSALVSQLEKAGVPVVFVDFRSYPMKNTLPSIQILGKALHRQAEAERYIKFYQSNLQKVTDVASQIPQDKKRKVFIELKAGFTDDCCSTAGNGNMGDFIDLAGGINIARTLLPTSLGTVNLEKVIATHPDIYIASGSRAVNSKMPGLVFGADVTQQQALDSVGNLLQRKGISSLQAVLNGNTHALSHNFYNSPYNVIAVQLFAKWIYPEQFKALDPKATMAQLYHEFLAIEPTGTYWLDSMTAR